MAQSEQIKSAIKSKFPGTVAAYHAARGALLRPSLKTVFSQIYHAKLWMDSESVSGRGSTLARTATIVATVPVLLDELEVKTLLDAACGDFNWMSHTPLNDVKYVGCDVVPELIKRNRSLYDNDHRTFIVRDITTQKLPDADAILCRDCLIHLSFKRIRDAVRNFRKTSAIYLLCTTHTSVRENTDCPDGGWRSVNLQLPPFNFPRPLKLIVEDAESGKHLGVWRLEELRAGDHVVD